MWMDAEYGERMASIFEHVRHRFDLLRECKDRGEMAQLRCHATEILMMAVHGGLHRLAQQAERIVATEHYVLREALDDMQRESDAAEALWRAAGWVL